MSVYASRVLHIPTAIILAASILVSLYFMLAMIVRRRIAIASLSPVERVELGRGLDLMCQRIFVGMPRLYDVARTVDAHREQRGDHQRARPFTHISYETRRPTEPLEWMPRLSPRERSSVRARRVT